MDGQAQEMGEPVELDTTQVSGSNNGKIYTNIVSEDKQWLMAVKINTKNPKDLYFYELSCLIKTWNYMDRHRIPMLVQDHADYVYKFRTGRSRVSWFLPVLHELGSGEYLTHVSFVTKGPRCGYFCHPGYRRQTTGFWMN